MGMGEASNPLAGLQGSRTGPVERYKSTGMGSPCYLAWGSESRSLNQAAEPAWVGQRAAKAFALDTTTIAVRNLFQNRVLHHPAWGIGEGFQEP